MRSQLEEAPPSVFTRSIETPPGLPWDQRRAAELEARAGSPVTDPMVQITVARQAPWRPNRPGRFQATYARPMPKVIQPFQSAPRDRWLPDLLFDEHGQLIYWAPSVGAAVFALAALLAVSVFAGRAASQADAMLAAAEAQLVGLAGEETGAARAVRAAEIVEAAGLTGSEIDRLIADLAWASRSRSSDAAIRELVWRGGQMVVVTDTDETPFTSEDRIIERIEAEAGRTSWRTGESPDREALILALEARVETETGIAE